MTDFEIRQIEFDKAKVRSWAKQDPKHSNWPIVYILNSSDGKKPTLADAYIGETVNAESRLLQHLDSPSKQTLKSVRVVLDETFNKSVCLDLESHLIRLLSGDGSYRVLNRNEGITDSNYFNRELYRESFRQIFEELRKEGLFSKSIPEIENSDLYKLSPFKALTRDQAVAIENIVDALLQDFAAGQTATNVVQGEPGTGKTIIATYLLKLLADIAEGKALDEVDEESEFSEYFTPENQELLSGLKIGMVVPQQSLRMSISNVFKQTPGLSKDQVLTPFNVGEAKEPWDLLIVDEAHRLNQRANQSSGGLNRRVIDINEKLFGTDDPTKTQLDWIKARSKIQLLLIDPLQSIRPADLPPEQISSIIDLAKSERRFFPLTSQMRVKAGDDYVGYIREILRPGPHDPAGNDPKPKKFEGYDLRFFDDVTAMHDEIRARDAECGLSRLVAGFAWEWKTKVDKSRIDIEIGASKLKWNLVDKDWINSPGAVDQVGSIHTVQGYDLNFAGVIIGNDLTFEVSAQELKANLSSYFDAKGKENNKKLGKTYTEAEILQYICNIYAVLLTRGMLGTYVYVCDPALREHLRPYFAQGTTT